MQRFTNQIALVTGGASGIGLSCVEKLIAEGAHVVVGDRNGSALEQVVSKFSDKVRGIEVDVSNWHDCENMVALALEQFGRLDVAINNAGIPAGFSNRFDEFDIEAWDKVISTNLNGVFYSMRAEAAAMRQAKSGAIVNTASVASLVANKGMASYVAAKHGVAGLTKAAALDLVEWGIRVNAVCPGFIRTPMTADLLEDQSAMPGLLAQVPMARAGEADEVASAILFLASKDSSYSTGALLTLDGGLTLW